MYIFTKVFFCATIFQKCGAKQRAPLTGDDFLEKGYTPRGAAIAVLKALGYFALWFFVQAVVVVFVTIAVGVTNPGLDDAALTERVNSLSIEMNILVGCGAVLFLALIAKLRGTTLSKQALIRPYPARFTLSFVIMGIFTAFAVAFILGIAQIVGIIPDSWVQVQSDTYADIRVANAFMQFLSVGFIAPVAEELLFRGCIFGTLKKEMHPWVAIVISAAIFGVAHLTPLGIIYATGLGILLGWLTWRTGSVVPSLLFHMAYNCTQAYSGGISILVAVISIPIMILLISSISKYYRGK